MFTDVYWCLLVDVFPRQVSCLSVVVTICPVSAHLFILAELLQTLLDGLLPNAASSTITLRSLNMVLMRPRWFFCTFHPHGLWEWLESRLLLGAVGKCHSCCWVERLWGWKSCEGFLKEKSAMAHQHRNVLYDSGIHELWTSEYWVYKGNVAECLFFPDAAP